VEHVPVGLGQGMGHVPDDHKRSSVVREAEVNLAVNGSFPEPDRDRNEVPLRDAHTGWASREVRVELGDIFGVGHWVTGTESEDGEG
jgi:hypothetical protein